MGGKKGKEKGKGKGKGAARDDWGGVRNDQWTDAEWSEWDGWGPPRKYSAQTCLLGDGTR